METPEPKEGIVLDAEGKTIHDPHAGRPKHVRVEWRTGSGPGLVPKVLLGGALIVLLFAGFAMAAVVLVSVALGWIFRRGRRRFK